MILNIKKVKVSYNLKSAKSSLYKCHYFLNFTTFIIMLSIILKKCHCFEIIIIRLAKEASQNYMCYYPGPAVTVKHLFVYFSFVSVSTDADLCFVFAEVSKRSSMVFNFE